MIKFILNFTVSKLLAYIILIIGSIYAFVYQSPEILIATFSASSAIIGVKTYTTSRERINDKKYAPNSEQMPDDI